jgi:DNA-binding transcriptional ArsR family regulator
MQEALEAIAEPRRRAILRLVRDEELPMEHAVELNRLT